MISLKKYAETAERVIGKRSRAKAEYDNEVLRWMHITKDINAAVAKADQKFPALAQNPKPADLPNILAYYDYLAVHGEIVARLKQQTAAKARMAQQGGAAKARS